MHSHGATRDQIEAVYRDRYAAFLRVAIAVSGDRASGADAVHDGFVRVVSRARSFRGQGSLEAWIWRAVVNEARKRGGRRRRFQLELRDAPEQAAVNGELQGDERVRAVVAALPERQRLILFLRYYADLDYAAIAEALGISQGTVGAALSAAHAALRSQLTEVNQCKI